MRMSREVHSSPVDRQASENASVPMRLLRVDRLAVNARNEATETSVALSKGFRCRYFTETAARRNDQLVNRIARDAENGQKDHQIRPDLDMRREISQVRSFDFDRSKEEIIHRDVEDHLEGQKQIFEPISEQRDSVLYQ